MIDRNMIISLGEIKKNEFLNSFFKDSNLLNIDKYPREMMLKDYIKIDEVLKGSSFKKTEDFKKEFGDLLEIVDDIPMEPSEIKYITIYPGRFKSGEKENFEEIKIFKGEIISLVGPTGSGKSRLLGDIEWGARGDTPSFRKVDFNGEIMTLRNRFSGRDKKVAHLSQNMNFVMDLTVENFLRVHGESRSIKDIEDIIEKVLYNGNMLTGEKFSLKTPITSLSGGQSRALMIADTAFISKSQIVLVDEIENAGVNKKKAMELLTSNDKIVIVATHDPVLALMSSRRLVINNGGVVKIIKRDKREVELLTRLEKLENESLEIREKLRFGKKIYE